MKGDLQRFFINLAGVLFLALVAALLVPAWRAMAADPNAKAALQFFYLEEPLEFERTAALLGREGNDLGLQIDLQAGSSSPQTAVVRFRDRQRTSPTGLWYFTIPEKLIDYQKRYSTNALRVSFSPVVMKGERILPLSTVNIAFGECYLRTGARRSPLLAVNTALTVGSATVAKDDGLSVSIQLRRAVAAATPPVPRPDADLLRRAVLPYFWLQNDAAFQSAALSVGMLPQGGSLALEATFRSGKNSATEVINLAELTRSTVKEVVVPIPPNLLKFMVAQGTSTVSGSFQPVALAPGGQRQPLAYRVACTGEYYEQKRESVAVAESPQGEVLLPTGALPPASTLYLHARFSPEKPMATAGNAPPQNFEIRIAKDTPESTLAAWQAIFAAGPALRKSTGLRLTFAARPPFGAVDLDLQAGLATLCRTGSLSLTASPSPGGEVEAVALRRATELNANEELTVQATIQNPEGKAEREPAPNVKTHKNRRVLVAVSRVGQPDPRSGGFAPTLTLNPRALSEQAVILHLRLAPLK